MNFFKWYHRHPKNRFWFAIGVIVFVLIPHVVTWTAPTSLTWIAILLNAVVAMWHMYNWLKLKHDPNS